MCQRNVNTLYLTHRCYMNLGWVAVSRSTVQRQWLTPTPYWTSTLWRGTRHWPHEQETRPHGGATVYAPPGAYVEAGCHTHGTVWATLHTCWSPRLGWNGDRTTVEEASGALRQWGFLQYLPFRYTKLKGKHCWHPHCRSGTCRYVCTGVIIPQWFGSKYLYSSLCPLFVL